MATIFDIVRESLEAYNADISEEMDRKNMDASGNAKNSLNVVQNGYIISSVGIDYIEYLNRGRPPGKFPPISAIERWVNLKGVAASPYAIARNIANNGTRIYRNRELGLKLEVKNAALEAELNEKLPTFIRNQITLSINASFKK